MIDITGLDKAVVLKELYDHSHLQGFGFLQMVPEGTVTVEHCRELLKHEHYFDYLYGRGLKVNLSSNRLNEVLYDRDNGLGAALTVIFKLRLTKKE